MARKPSMGRQKIEIKRIDCEASRQVTFSKRRAGLFKKASELCTLCGAETAILVFSPAGKVFSFGHPCVESVIERFLAQDAPRMEYAAALPLVDAHRGASVRELNRQYTEVMNNLEVEKKRAEAFQQVVAEAKMQGEPWWEGPIENMGGFELQELKIHMDELKNNMGKHADELVAKAAAASPFLAMNPMGRMDRFAASARVTHPSPNNASSIIPYGHGYGYGYGYGFGRSPF